MSKGTLPWNKSRTSLKAKVNEILKKQHLTNKQLLNDLIKENPVVVDKFISEGEDWAVPRDIACALYQRSQEAWSTIGCSTTTKRKSKSFVNFILGKLHWR